MRKFFVLKHKKIFLNITSKIQKIKIHFFNIGLAEKNSAKTFYINKISSTSTFSQSKNSFFSNLKKFILNSNNFYEKKYIIKTKKLDDYFIKKKN